MKEFEGKTDDELESLREASSDNVYVPGSVYHRITRELERRHRKRIEKASERPTIGILNQGENNKFVGNTFTGFDIGIKDEGKFTQANDNIFQHIKNSMPEGRFQFWSTIILIIIAIISIPILQPTINSYFSVPTDKSVTSSEEMATSTISLAEILSKALTYETVVERQDFLKKYVGSSVLLRGPVQEVSRSYNGFLVDLTTNGQMVTCAQDENEVNEKTLPLLKGRQVQIMGTFTFTSSYGHGLNIDDCVLTRIR